MKALEHFAEPAGARDEVLWLVQVLVCDSTASNTGLSSDDKECLNDAQVAAAMSELPQPERYRVRLTYPLGDASHPHEHIFQSKSFAANVSGKKPIGALVQSYIKGFHWYKLIFLFGPKLLLYFEPMGSRLSQVRPRALLLGHSASYGEVDPGPAPQLMTAGT